jgi:hypothetical protein
VDGQKRRPVPVEVEHARLLLCCEDDRLQRSSCSTALASETSAMINLAIRASSVIVSSVSRILGFSKSNRIGR